MPILVTGANGFVGRRLCHVLTERGYGVRAAVRQIGAGARDPGKNARDGAVQDVFPIGNIDSGTDWSDALIGVDSIVHLAARVHILQEVSENPLESFRSVNVFGSKHLAEVAVRTGVKRFIYVSSISVHGNSTGERAYVEEDEAYPRSPYAISKWEAELSLKSFAQESGLELVIIRPPLVYGPGVGGNFLRLMRMADRGLPLPLGSVKNLRSFIGIDNLVELLVTCTSHPAAAGETFLVADGEDLSTPDLIRHVARLLGRPARLVPFPVSVLRAVSTVARMDDVVDRLCNCLQVDAGKARRLLGWRPQVSLSEGFERTVRWYLDEYRAKRSESTC